MAFILWLSSGDFNAKATGTLLGSLLQWLLPWATASGLDWAHYGLRKLAHLAEYAILALLWYRAFRHGRRLQAGPASAMALLVAAVWASLDEWYQSTIPSRTGSVADVILDSSAAAAALTAVYLGRRAARLLAGVLLWTAAVGGILLLVLNWSTGVGSGLLWITTPAAWLAVWLRYRGLLG